MFLEVKVEVFCLEIVKCYMIRKTIHCDSSLPKRIFCFFYTRQTFYLYVMSIQLMDYTKTNMQL